MKIRIYIFLVSIFFLDVRMEIYGLDQYNPENPDSESESYIFQQKVPRYALVFGAENYSHIAQVKNAQNDAQLMTETLSSVGFNVEYVPNPDKEQLLDKIDEFQNRQLKEAENLGVKAIVLFFFAGHGFQFEGYNYIVPVDAKPQDLDRLVNDSIDIPNILDVFTNNSIAMSILILDACRNNILDFGYQGNRSAQARSRNGFTIQDTPDRVLIGFATKSNKIAKSYTKKSDKNSPYTKALALHIPYRGMMVEQTFKRTRYAVEKLTKNGQSPVEHNSLIGDFYFNPSQEHIENMYRKWLEALQSSKQKSVEEYIIFNPDSPYIGAAVAWLNDRSFSN